MLRPYQPHQAYIAQMRNMMKASDKKAMMVNFVEGDDVAKAYVEQLGFKGEKSDYKQMKRSLETIPEVKLPDGFSIRSAAGVHEAEALGEVHNGAFGPKWNTD